MKALVLTAVMFTLTGCAAIDAYFMAKFDPNEYELVNDIRTISQLSIANCKDQTQSLQAVDQLYLKSVQFKNYVEFIPGNEKAIKLSTSLVEITEPMYKRYHEPKPVSEAYCKQKLSLLEKSTTTIEQVLGDKPR